jgi:hypothetical protein
MHQGICASSTLGAVQNTSAPRSQGSPAEDPEEVTKKWGLEAGLFSSFRKGNNGVSAKDLLQRYGTAYLITSISLALISFSACYFAVDAGVDVPSLLSRFGISVPPDSAMATGSKVALAYTAHKALSPVRFPPTVALTPIVASRMGRSENKGSSGEKEDDEKPQS